MRKKWGAVLSSALIITLFSGCGILTNLLSDTPPPPNNQTVGTKNQTVETQTSSILTASDILSKSSDAMDRMDGYKWHANAVQNLLFKSNLVRAKNTVNSDVEYISPNELHTIFTVTTESGGQSQSLYNEVYSTNGKVYVKNQNNPWVDSTATASRELNLSSLERDYCNPDYIFRTFRQEASSLRVSTVGEDYVLTISLKDDQRIRSFTQAATSNLTRANNIADWQINYTSLELSLYINKTDFIIDKITQKLELDLPMEGQSTTLSQDQTIQFKGEIKEIILPAEVYTNRF